MYACGLHESGAHTKKAKTERQLYVRLTTYSLKDPLREPPLIFGRASPLRAAWLSLVFAAG